MTIRSSCELTFPRAPSSSSDVWGFRLGRGNQVAKGNISNDTFLGKQPVETQRTCKLHVWVSLAGRSGREHPEINYVSMY